MSFNNKLTKLHIWLLKRIFKKAVIQGPNHKNNIELIFKMLREAAYNEFNEDNAFTLNSFMQECFESSQFHFQNPKKKSVDYFIIADQIIHKAYPGKKNMWGGKHIPNYGILCGAIEAALRTTALGTISLNATNYEHK